MESLISNFRLHNRDNERKGMMLLTVDWASGRNPCRRNQEMPKFQPLVAHEWWNQFQTTQFKLWPEFR